MLAAKQEGLRVIVGLGKTGLACARYFSNCGIPFAVTDSRQEPPGLAELQQELHPVCLALGGFDANLIAGASEVIVSPGVSLRNAILSDCLQKGIPLHGDIEIFALQAKAPICAITGSNAKSTVTMLMVEMLRAAGRCVRYGGNIGIPALDLICDKEPDNYVLELSSFQLESTDSLKPHVATILNISPDHMDRYANLSEYIAAKQRIYRGAEFIVWNRDDPATYPQDNNGNYAMTSFGLSVPRSGEFGILPSDAGLYLAYGDEALISVRELYIKGMHNYLNALAALALGYALALPMPAMLQVLRDFKGLEHRCQWVAEKGGITWFNDSKGTNVGASIAAINGLGSAIDGKLILIMGGQGKGGDFAELQQPIAQYVKHVVLIGEDAAIIEAAIADQVSVTHAQSMQQAIQLANKAAQPGDAVLLSPACASFDMFDNFEHRGHVFINAVKENLL